MDIKLFIATKAFVNYQGRILILRESAKYSDGSNAGRYDVVGGRLIPGQKFDESLLREIKEETNLTIRFGKPFYVGEWRPVIKGNKCQIVGVFFECFADSNIVILSEDHDKYEWIDPENYREYDIITNLADAFEAYLKR